MTLAKNFDAEPVSFVSASIKNLSCSSGVFVDDVSLLKFSKIIFLPPGKILLKSWINCKVGIGQ